MVIITTFVIYLFIQLLIMVPFTVHSQVETSGGSLKVGFYANSCPQVEEITKSITEQLVKQNPSLGAGMLRLFAHDCFVRGCDGSVLLNSTMDHAEKNAAPNSQSLKGYNIVDQAKAAVENACPGVVSCADILALATRDATVAIGGPTWQVETGRRDGVISKLNEANANLPSPFLNITELKESFLSRGLNAKDLIVLSAAHNVGVSHCSSVTPRLWEFNGVDMNSGDPSLDPVYMEVLRKVCPFRGPEITIPLKPGNGANVFDDAYFDLVMKKRVLFKSDIEMLEDQETKAYIESHQTGKKDEFFRDFGESMIKMGRIDVLTGAEGEIRKVCYSTNQPVTSE